MKLKRGKKHMMEDKRTDLHRAKDGVAMLAACIVQTLNERTLISRNGPCKGGKAYPALKDETAGDVIQQLKMLSWTRAFLAGFNHITGQQKPFLAD